MAQSIGISTIEYYTRRWNTDFFYWQTLTAVGYCMSCIYYCSHIISSMLIQLIRLFFIKNQSTSSVMILCLWNFSILIHKFSNEMCKYALRIVCTVIESTLHAHLTYSYIHGLTIDAHQSHTLVLLLYSIRVIECSCVLNMEQSYAHTPTSEPHAAERLCCDWFHECIVCIYYYIITPMLTPSLWSDVNELARATYTRWYQIFHRCLRCVDKQLLGNQAVIDNNACTHIHVYDITLIRLIVSLLLAYFWRQWSTSGIVSHPNGRGCACVKLKVMMSYYVGIRYTIE